MVLRKLLEDRKESLNGLEKDIEIALQDLKMEAVDKDGIEKRERFEGVSKELQVYVREYIKALESFLKEKSDFSFTEYDEAFKQKDVKLNSLLEGYMFFRKKLS